MGWEVFHVDQIGLPYLKSFLMLSVPQMKSLPPGNVVEADTYWKNKANKLTFFYTLDTTQGSYFYKQTMCSRKWNNSVVKIYLHSSLLLTPIESHVHDCGSLETEWRVLIPQLYSEWVNGLMYVVLKVVIHVMKYPHMCCPVIIQE